MVSETVLKTQHSYIVTTHDDMSNAYNHLNQTVFGGSVPITEWDNFIGVSDNVTVYAQRVNDCHWIFHVCSLHVPHND